MFNAQTLAANPNFQRFARVVAFLTGVLFFALTFIFVTRSSLALSIWPWSYTTLPELSYFFLASVCIAIAMPVLRIAFTGELAAAVGGGFNLVITFIGSGIFMLQTYSTLPASTGQRVLNGAIFCGVMLLGILFTWWTTRALKFKETRPVPKLVRLSFGVFAAVLILGGTLLVFKQPVFPWRLSGEASIVYGWVFLGAGVYFGYSCLRPLWGNVSAQLLGFLAYNVILLPVLLSLFPTVKPEFLLNLVIYTAVLIYSSGLAIYYLFIYPETRWRLARAKA
jgi:hypothetical protein